MSFESPIARVVSLLEVSGYRVLERPITVGGIPFEFAAMLAGEASLDLIVLVDTLSENDTGRIRTRVEGLSRALDLVRSRRPLTIILIGPRPNLALTHALARVSRVLVTGTPTGESAGDDLKDAIAVLLPLHVSAGGEEAAESWVGIRDVLLASHRDACAVALFESASLGARAVSETLREVLAAPFAEDDQ